MEENNLQEPQYKKSETMRSLEILLGIEEEPRRGVKKGEKEEESVLVTRARELRTKLDALLKEDKK